jgi:hypothetical protein
MLLKTVSGCVDLLFEVKMRYALDIHIHINPREGGLGPQKPEQRGVIRPGERRYRRSDKFACARSVIVLHANAPMMNRR